MRRYGGLSGEPVDGDTGVEEAVVSKKPLHNASTKVASVVERMLLPLLDIPLRSHVDFTPVDEQAEFDLMDEVHKRRPEVMHDAATFGGYFQSLYERYMYVTRGYATVRS